MRDRCGLNLKKRSISTCVAKNGDYASRLLLREGSWESPSAYSWSVANHSNSKNLSHSPTAVEDTEIPGAPPSASGWAAGPARSPQGQDAVLAEAVAAACLLGVVEH